MLKLSEIYAVLRRDNSLTQAIERSWLMLDRTHAMFRESVRALRDGGEQPGTLDIRNADRLVNADQQEARRQIFRHLAITGGLNLTAGLVLTGIVIDLERIGDYTKNIRDLADAHPARLDSGRHSADIRRIEDAVSTLFEGTATVVRSADADGARALIGTHLWIKRTCDDIARDLTTGTGSDLTQSDAVTTALYARYLKRVAAHLMNILSSVINPFDRVGYREVTEDAADPPRE